MRVRREKSRPPRLARLETLGLVVGLAFVAACDRFCPDDLQTLPEPTDQVDLFQQKAAAKVDILWIIDNSGSMAAEQSKVATRFNDFFSQLVTSQVDYHIGVITTDPAEGGVLRQYPQAAPDVTNCDGCRFLTKDVPCSNPGVVVPPGGDEGEIESLLSAECPAQLVFRKLIQAGIEGSAFEEGFRVAAMALGADVIDPVTGFPVRDPPPENEGFLREDASLYIIFVSDEDEGAKEDGTPVRYYQRLFEGIKSAGNENKVSVSAITGWTFGEGLPRMDELCSILQTGFDGVPTNDHPSLPVVKEVFGDPEGNPCFDASADPNDQNARADTGGRYIELACRTGGVVSNMCDEDYSTALDALGANAAGLLRKFPLSRPGDLEAGGDCVPFTQDDQGSKLDCDEDGTTNGAVDEVICVKARPIGTTEGAETLVPRSAGEDRPPNWVFEAGTSSIRFEGNFIPAPGSTVEIRYPLKAASRQCPVQ